MTNQERIKKYKEEHSSRCKNKTKNDREIRYTKCVYYEREN